jgi:hypothetical protein
MFVMEHGLEEFHRIGRDRLDQSAIYDLFLDKRITRGRSICDMMKEVSALSHPLDF